MKGEEWEDMIPYLKEAMRWRDREVPRGIRGIQGRVWGILVSDGEFQLFLEWRGGMWSIAAIHEFEVEEHK